MERTGFRRSRSAKTVVMSGLHDKLAQSHPSLERGRVWCKTCRATQKGNSAACLKFGWPKCCGHTMTIDHPDTWLRQIPRPSCGEVLTPP
jgi:hypothetical protein